MTWDSALFVNGATGEGKSGVYPSLMGWLTGFSRLPLDFGMIIILWVGYWGYQVHEKVILGQGDSIWRESQQAATPGEEDHLGCQDSNLCQVNIPQAVFPHRYFFSLEVRGLNVLKLKGLGRREESSILQHDTFSGRCVIGKQPWRVLTALPFRALLTYLCSHLGTKFSFFPSFLICSCLCPFSLVF